VKAIWKFTLGGPLTTVEMPEGARILSVQMQAHEPQIWALVDPDAPKVKRTFKSLPTGHVSDADHENYIGTVLMSGGALVFHIFEHATR
jgi:hypothetical protein